MFLKANFLVTLSATLGSLYFSEVLKYPPCPLCWHQRICLYPLVVIFGVAIWSDDHNYKRYALPLATIGASIAGFHNLLYYGLIDEGLSPCTAELSCTAQQLNIFGFITIPLLSLLGFITIIAFTIIGRRRS